MRGAKIICAGHPSIRATDPQDIEIIRGEQCPARGSVIGYRAEYDPDSVLALRGRLLVKIACDGVEDRFEATVSPLYHRSQPLTFHRSPAVRERCFAMQSSKGAADLAPELRARICAQQASIHVTLETISDAPLSMGALFLVGMPIGNQADLTPRALDILSSVDLIFAEDTRVAHDALSWRGIRTPMRSCFDHNERVRAAELVSRLARGERIAVISDAGMPGVSDPGYRLVRAALDVNAPVTVAPGASAVLTALVLSGLPVATFQFLGFPPRKTKERLAFLSQVLSAQLTSVFFESPRRISDLLADIAIQAPGRTLALCQDLTKSTEHVVRGTAADVAAAFAPVDEAAGEVTLVIAGEVARTSENLSEKSLRTHELTALIEALVAAGCPTAPLAKALQRVAGVKRNAAYDLITRLKRAMPVSVDSCGPS
jgi:16S rRNA (cytidine1402-2'-O)-methyltransferase